jgi:hypothetical protein
MPALCLGFDGALVSTMIELISTRPTTSSGHTAPAAALTITIVRGFAGV